MITKLSMRSLSAIACSVLLLSGCVAPMATPHTSSSTATTVSAGLGIGKVVFQTAVNASCQTELEKSTRWRAAKIIMSSSKQEQVKATLCGCVSQEASKNVTIDQLMVAAIDNNSRKSLISTAVNNSLSACYGQVMKSIIR